MIVVFSGALVPLDRLPGWMAEIGRFAPISQGIVSLRALMVDGRASLPIQGDGGLLWLIGTSAAYLLAGVAAFSLGERMARRQGSLSRY